MRGRIAESYRTKRSSDDGHRRKVTTDWTTTEKTITKRLTIKAPPTMGVAESEGRLGTEEWHGVAEKTVIADGRLFYS